MKSGKHSILLSVVFFGFALLASAEKRPVIGVSDTYKDGTTTVPRSYVNAVLSNGGIPVVIPLMTDENEIRELLNSLDGIIFTGGEDYDPAYYNERPIPQMGTINAPRDQFDIKLLQLAAERGIPVLGICRGAQLINIVFGGSLYQDLPAQYADNSIHHRQRQSSTEASHAVNVEENTVFADIVKDRMLMVNSSHHQAVKEIAKGFRVAGKSPDSVVEVIEKIDDENWILGVQFHPEMRVSSDMAMRRIFQRFIEEAVSSGNKNRSVNPVVAARPLTAHELSQGSQTGSRIETASVPQIIYKNIIDTQYINTTVHDTVFFPVATDTVRIFVSDTIFINVSDTVYLTISESVKLDSVLMDSSKMIDMVAIETISIEKDTLIFTPGEIASQETEKSGSSKSKMKREEKTKIKNEKKEAEEKQMQLQKEYIESERQKLNQKKKEKKEQEEKEKFEKKVAKEREKQFKQNQKDD